MLLNLLEAISAIEEAPTNKVETTAELTTKLLWTLNIGNLLEQLIGISREIGKFQIGQTSTVTNLVNPVDSLLGRTIYLVLTLSSAKQHVRIAHHAEIDTAVQTCYHLIIKTCTQVGILGNRQSTVVVIGYNRSIGSHRHGIANVSILKSVPFGLIGTDCPIEAWIERTSGGLLGLKELIEPWRG